MGAKWEKEEDDNLRRFYPEHGACWEGDGLRDGWKYYLAGRTRNAIQTRAWLLGVRKKVYRPKDGFKRCACCKVEKPIGEFGTLAKSPDGRNCYCKNCNRLMSREYRRSQRSINRVAM